MDNTFSLSQASSQGNYLLNTIHLLKQKLEYCLLNLQDIEQDL